jgi:uncharacterized protein (DUF1684 family)
MNEDAEQWERELAAKREEKDRFFAEHAQSPIPPGEREGFDGLSYFPPNPDYRVTATVERHDDPDPIPMETTAGREVRYLRVATLWFDLHRDADAAGRGDLSLGGYRQERDEDGALFVPFRDKTTGQQTYRTGRYMELAAERDLADGDEIPLDFNLAYTPFCAYSDTFDCPLPPEENWLELPIPAGERFESA